LESTVARPRCPRWLAYLLAVGAALLAALGIPGPAWAADEPNALTIAGPGLSSPVALHANLDSDLFTRLLHQVSWMAGAGGATLVPDPAALGPKFTLTVFSGGKPLQTYDVYPEAKGGPKAFRPKNQPQGKGSDAWFYVSMSVPELMQAAGVPMTDPAKAGLEYQDPAGYIPAASDTHADRPLLNLKQIVNAQRRTLLAWAGSAVVVLSLVVLAARLSRRRYAS
jgi:hypothetical protein